MENAIASGFDEMQSADDGCREPYRILSDWLRQTPKELIEQRRKEAEILFRRIGTTFAVYGDKQAEERIIPFDIIPRILTGDEWGRLSRGLKQRVTAINRFLCDVYSRQEILRAGILPPELVFANPAFRPEMMGRKVPSDIVGRRPCLFASPSGSTIWARRPDRWLRRGTRYLCEGGERCNPAMKPMFSLPEGSYTGGHRNSPRRSR